MTDPAVVELSGTERETDVGARAVLSAVARRPGLWLVALSTARSLVSRRWWRSRPFLPIPDRRWMRFRTVTAYGGDGDEPLHVDDVITYLEWRRTFPR